MLRTTRQIRTEEDRFGGYSNNASVSDKINRFEADTEDAFPRTNETYFADIPETNISASRRASKDKEQSLYSKRKEYESFPQTAEFVGQPSYVRRPARATRNAESVMPSIKTRKVLEDKEEQKQTVERRSSLSFKTKAMLCVYAAVVVALAAIVIATGIMIGGMGSSVEALQAEITSKNTILTQQNAELSALDSDTMVLGQATELGMVKPETSKNIELLPMGETVSYDARTNWFDKFCDWLSNLIGG